VSWRSAPGSAASRRPAPVPAAAVGAGTWVAGRHGITWRHAAVLGHPAVVHGVVGVVHGVRGLAATRGHTRGHAAAGSVGWRPTAVVRTLLLAPGWRIRIGVWVRITRRHRRRHGTWSHSGAATHRGWAMSTVAVVVHLVSIYFGVGGLHLDQFTSDAEVLQSQDLLGGFRRIERDETEATAFLRLLVVKDLHVLYFPVFFEGFLDFVCEDVAGQTTQKHLVREVTHPQNIV